MFGMRYSRLLCSSIQPSTFIGYSILSLFYGMYLVSRECFTYAFCVAHFTVLMNPPCSGSFENIQLSPLYFDRQDVKEAIHAPTDVSWSECSNVNVFPNGDSSLPSSFTVLPNVIEKSERTVVAHGLADFILIAEGLVVVMRGRCEMNADVLGYFV